MRVAYLQAEKVPENWRGQIFCESCYEFHKGDASKKYPGWGNHTIDRCFHLGYMKEVPECAREKIEEAKERMKSGEKRKYEERSPKPPNPAWGMEEMKRSSLKDPEAKTQVHEVKGSDEEEIKEKEAKESAGSSKDKPKDKQEKKDEKERKIRKRGELMIAPRPKQQPLRSGKMKRKRKMTAVIRSEP